MANCPPIHPKVIVMLDRMGAAFVWNWCRDAAVPGDTPATLTSRMAQECHAPWIENDNHCLSLAADAMHRGPRTAAEMEEPAPTGRGRS